MTVVGDIAQATGAVGPRLAGTRSSTSCPRQRPARRTELTVGYRLPEPDRWSWPPGCCAIAAPDLAPPRSVREDGAEPSHPPGRPGRARPPRSWPTAVDERAAVEPGSVAVIVPPSVIDEVVRRPRRAGHRRSAGPPATASTTRSPWSRSAW